MKKFEEGVFSDLRNLKPGVDASLEEPKVSRRVSLMSFSFSFGCTTVAESGEKGGPNVVPFLSLTLYNPSLVTRTELRVTELRLFRWSRRLISFFVYEKEADYVSPLLPQDHLLPVLFSPSCFVLSLREYIADRFFGS